MTAVASRCARRVRGAGAMAPLAAALLLASDPGHPPAAHAAPSEAYRLAATWRTDASVLPEEAFLDPRGIDVDVDPFDGTLLVYLVDEGNARVQVFAGDGTFVRTLAGPGPAPAGLTDPRDVAVQGSLVFVTDYGADRVALYTVDGAYVGAWTGLSGPWGIAADDAGSIYVVENTASRIARFNSDGSRPTPPTWGGFGGGVGQLNRPEGAAVMADGRLVVADAGNDRLVVWQASPGRGDQVDESGALPATPVDVDVDPATGDLFAVRSDDTIGRYDDQLGLPPVGGGLTLTGAAGIAAGRDARGRTVLYATFRDLARAFHGVRRWEGSPPTPPVERPEWGGVPAPLGRIEAPFRIAAAPAGGEAALLADRWPRVQVLDAGGAAVRQMPAGRLEDMAALPDGGMAVAADDGVERIAADGTRAWRRTLPAAGGEYAWAVAVDHAPAQDRLAVLDLGGQRVRLLDGQGNPRGEWSFRPAPGAAAQLWDLAPAGPDAFWVVNRSADTLEQRHAATGARTAAWPVPGRPVRVAADAAGNAYVLNWFGWVLKYDAAGDVRAAWAATDPQDPASEARDLAVDAAGRVLVADSALDVVRVFEPDPAGTPGPVPDFEPACRASGDKSASPTRLALGEETTITLAVGGACPDVRGRVDVVLVIDHSGSMLGPGIAAAKDAANAFVDLVDLGQDRVALVGFNQAALVIQPLTGNASNLRRGIGGLQAGGGTDIAAGVDEARRELTGPRRRASAASVIILLTDGGSDPVAAARAADQAKLEGARIITIGAGNGVNEPLLRALASAPDDYYFAPTFDDLGGIYRAIARRITASVLFAVLTVTDELPANMAYVAGSAAPPPSAVNGQTLVWQLADVPMAGTALTYRVRPLETGTHPTNVFALGEGTDGFGRRGRVDFPIPTVVVVAVTGTPPPTDPAPVPTPTPSATPTTPPTPTPSAMPRPTAPPRPIYLPLARKDVCLQRRQHVDVALVVDTSDSMLDRTSAGRTKLAAAVDAAGQFVALLDLAGGDAAAVVGFNSAADIRQGLTRDAAALRAALAGLPQSPGTRIDLGLARAGTALAGPGRTAANLPVAVVLTDGRPTGTTDAAVATAAADLRAAGVRVYAIGLGDDVDAALLARVASGPDQLVLTPDAEDLARIYTAIARDLPCVVP